MTTKYPVLIPYIKTADNGLELKYTLRSLKNLTDWNGEVYIVGDREDWFSDIWHIPVSTIPNQPLKDVENKIRIALTRSGIEDDYIYMNDDIYICSKTKTKWLHRGELQGDTTGYYRKLKLYTRKWLALRGITEPLDYEVHAPVLMNKEKRLEISKHIVASNYSVQARSLYGNMYKVGGELFEDKKTHSSKLLSGQIISTQDFTDELQKLFPKKSQFEEQKNIKISKKKNKLTFSVSVMAHESRAKHFDYLKKHLGDVPFSIDDNKQKLGTWGNCKRAWSLRDKTKDYHLVIQDDAVLCDNFMEKVSEFINKYPNESYQLFRGKKRQSWAIGTAKLDVDVLQGQLLWGVAIMLRQDIIEPAIHWGEQNFVPSYPDDTRIKKYLDSKGIKTLYPYPSLVDHRTIQDSLVNNIELRTAEWFIDQKHIPKIIHQMWIGDPAKRPDKWINTWKVDGWEHRLWTETEIDELKLKNRKQYDYYYNSGQYHGASDVARLEILEKYGGMYIDADTERLRDFTGDYLYADIFAVNESDIREGLGHRIANGIIGCQPHSPTIKEYIKRIGEAKKLEPIWDTIGGTMFTSCIQDIAEPRTAILESYWYLPVSYTGKRHPKATNPFSMHHWCTTLNKYGKDI